MAGLFDDLIPQQGRNGMFDDLLPPKQRNWSDVPGEALSNAPSSAANLGRALIQPIMAPVETAKNLGRVFAGVGSKIVGAADTASEYLGGPDLQTPEQKAYAEAPLDAVTKFYGDRYGSVEGLKNTLATDPVGAAADAAMVLYGGGALAPGRAGQAISKAGSVVDPIANTGRAVAKTAEFAGNRVADALGVTTGAGSLPIRTAYDAGRSNNAAFRDQMRGDAPMDEVVTMAERGVDNIVRQRSADYKANSPLGEPGNRPPEAMQPLDMRPITRKLAESSGMARFQGVTYNKGAAQVLQDVTDLLDAFKQAPNGRSAVALDRMKQAVYDIASGYKPGTSPHKIAMDVYHEIKNQIRTQLPSYDNAMKEYSRASELINEMRRTLSINDKATTDTTMRKLQSVMRNNVNTNYGQRQKLVEALAKTEPDLPYALAGQTLNDWAPRGLARAVAGGAGFAAYANPSLIPALAAASPRLAGEAAFGAGRGVTAIEQAAAKANLSPERLARILIALQATGNLSREASQ